jgi:hypothetical protein
MNVDLNHSLIVDLIYSPVNDHDHDQNCVATFAGFADQENTWKSTTADLDAEKTGVTDPRSVPWYVGATTGLFVKSQH